MKNITKVYLTILFATLAAFSNHAFAQNPFLVVTDISALPNLNVGNVSEFVYEIKNNGASGSRIDSIMFKLIQNPNTSFYPSAGHKFYLTWLNADVLPSYYTVYTYPYYNPTPPANSYSLVAGNNYITAPMLQSLTGTGYLAQDSIIYLHIPFSVINCDDSTGGAHFYRDSTTIHGKYRDTNNISSPVSVNAGNPNFTGTVTVLDSASFCSAVNKDTAEIGFQVTNSDASSGSPYADSIRLYVYCDSSVSTMDVNSFRINGHNVSSAYITHYISTPYNVYLVDLTTFPAGANGHPFGHNTVCDMSGQGYADDLGKDSSFGITATIIYKTSGCPPYGSQTSWTLPGIVATWNNECNTEPFHSKYIAPNTSPMYAQLVRYFYSANQGTAKMTCPADITVSAPDFNMDICPAYEQFWLPNGFKFDCPHPDYQLTMHMPKGYHLNGGSPELYKTYNDSSALHSSIYTFTPAIELSPYFGCSGPQVKDSNVTIEEFYADTTLVINFGKMPLSNCVGSTSYVPPCFNVPLELVCPDFTDTGVNIEADNFYYSYQYICDTLSCGTCGDTLSIASTSTYHHCEGTCTSYTGTDPGWIFERTNLGFKNQAFPHYYDSCGGSGTVLSNTYLIGDTVLINKNEAYPGDEVEALVNGSFVDMPSRYQNIFLQIRHPAIAGSASPYYLFELDPDKPSYFTVTGCTGVPAINSTPLYLSTPLVSNRTFGDFYNGHGQVQMSYSLDSAIGHTNHTWDSLFRHDNTHENLTLSAHVYLRVKNDTKAEFYNYPYYLKGGLNTVNVRTEYMADLKDATQHSSDTIHSCDSWGSSINLLQSQPTLSIGNQSDSSACDTFNVQFVFTAPVSVTNNDDFPYEFRPFAQLDSIVKVVLPPGYSYVRTEFYTYIDSANGNPSDNYFAGGAVRRFFNVTPTISGDTLQYTGASGCWPIIDQKVPNHNEPQGYYMKLYLLPSCTLTGKDSVMCYAGYKLGTQQSDTAYQVHVTDNLKQMLKHNNPAVTLNLPPTVSDYSDLLSFQFNYCTTNIYKATVPWIAFENVAGYLVNIKDMWLKDANLNVTYSILNGGHIYSNGGDSGIIFNLDPLGGGADSCHLLTVYAYIDSNSRACPPPDSGKMVVRFGNICSGIITNPNTSTCQNQVDTFRYDLFPTTLQLFQNGYTPYTCLNGGHLVDSLVIESANLGTVDSVKFYVYPPAGAHVDSVKYTYPCDTVTFTPKPSTLHSHVFAPDYTHYNASTGALEYYGWDLDHDFGMNGLPGTLAHPSSSDSNNMCVKVYMTMSCSYDDKDSIKFKATGYSACHKLLKDSLYVTPKVNDTCCMETCEEADGPYDLTIKGNITARDLNNGSITYACQNILIEGKYTVNEDVTFWSCNIAFAPNALIDVDSNHTLSIISGGSCTHACNHLYAACDTMWRGIFIEPGSSVVITDYNLIEDADTALYLMNGASASMCTIDLAVFNHNYKDILVGPYSGYYPGFIEESLFTDRNFDSISVCNDWRYDYHSAPPTNISKYPNAGTQTKIAWQIDTVGHFGDGTTLYRGGNAFDNVQMAIYDKASNMTICRDTFANISANAAIYSEGTGADSLNIGGPPAYYEPNCFRNVTKAINSQGQHQCVNILYNSIRDVASSPSSSFAIQVAGMDKTGATLNIEADTIENFLDGIVCDVNSIVTANINYNTITDSVCSIGSGTIVGISAIESPSSSTAYTIDANRITNINEGVLVNGANGVTIASNTINLKNPAASCTSAQYTGKGIQIVGGQNVNVGCNQIIAPTLNGSHPNKYIGIIENGSTGVTLEHDTTTNEAIHIEFKSNPATGDNLWFNILTTGDSGIFRSVATMSGYGGASDATENAFGGTFNCELWNPAHYYWSASLPATCGTIAQTHTSPISHSCPSVPSLITSRTARVIGENNVDTVTIDSVTLAAMLNAARSKDVFDANPDTNAILVKYGVLAILWQHPYLLSNTILGHFNDSMNVTSLGKIMAIDTAMTSKYNYPDYSALIANLNNIVPNNNVEQYLKLATQGYLDYKMGGLNQAELATLRNVASMCPDFNGAGVVLARSVVSPYDSVVVVYPDGCNSNANERILRNDSTTTKNRFSLYPNPNNGGFTVEYNLSQGQIGELLIYNLLGQKMNDYSLDATTNRMNITDNSLNNGLYLYVISVDGKVVKQDKLVIIK